ncbi:hypothetical protein F5I97DRAFT_421970 [Phlebopus sp. FC_14]|nr:hypothetical protein F5I97DRAFT_421970 [Phlebopus sp. FC_14]
MEPPAELLHHHKKTLHLKRTIGKYAHPTDSPTYDASEEDNDPLTDDGGSAMSLPVPARTNRPPNAPNVPHGMKSAGTRTRHHLASSMLSDDGGDSQTYDGDVEFSAMAGAGSHHVSKATFHYPNLHRSSSASTLTSQVDDKAPSRLISQQLEPPQTAKPGTVLDEPASADVFDPATLSAEDIQAFVRRAIEGEAARRYPINPPPVDRPVRVFADGVYDLFHFGHALQLRQAKLSFPNVYLLAGVNTDEDVQLNKARCVMSHLERCEAVRHCRWVDEVIPDTPWVLDASFLEKWQIDYVAHDELPYASEGHEDVYAFVKEQGKFIPTRRTPGISTSDLLERIVSGYRKRDFDKKLEKMGLAELKAEGSDFEDRSSRSHSPTKRCA